MKIAITGGTGFIGTGLVDFLLKKGHSVTVLSRNVSRASAEFGSSVRALKWSTGNLPTLAVELDGTDAIINLAGENIGSSLWTGDKKKKILESRVSAGELVSDVVESMTKKPKVVIQASAVGYYGDRDDERLDENSLAGQGFLAEVARRWEDSTKKVEEFGVRRALVRTGVVLSSKGGALPKIALPYRFFAGTVLGSGRQWLPWIHYSDELEAIHFLLTTDSASGVFNLVSPSPAKMKDVCLAIGKALHRPTIMKVPDFALKLLLGQMGKETILPSQLVVPERLVSHGFAFKHPELPEAVAEIINEGAGR